MYQRIDKKKIRRMTMELFQEQLFCNMFATLQSIEKEYAELSPVEVWTEARMALSGFARSVRPDFAIGMLKEDLAERYETFSDAGTEILRNDEEVERTTFLVMMVMMYMLVSGAACNDENPHREHCRALAGVTGGHPLLERLWLGIRHAEEEEEKADRKMEVVNYLLDMDASKDMEQVLHNEQQKLVGDLVNHALEYSVDTMEKQIVVLSDLNERCGHVFDGQLQVLRQGVKDKQNGKQVVKYIYHIDKVDQLNAMVKEGAEVIHTKTI